MNIAFLTRGGGLVILEGANIAKAAARSDVGKDRKDLGGKIFSKKKRIEKKKVIHSRFVRVILAQGPC